MLFYRACLVGIIYVSVVYKVLERISEPNKSTHPDKQLHVHHEHGLTIGIEVLSVIIPLCIPLTQSSSKH